MPVAKTICAELLEELNAFSRQHLVPDQFSEARFKRSIAALKKSSPAEGYLCEAILYTLHKDYAKVKECYRSIFYYLPNDADMRVNFGNSLLRLNHLNEALEQYMQAHTILRASKHVFNMLSSCAHATCRTDVFLAALEIYIRATGDENIINDPEIEAVIDLNDQLSEMEIEPLEANKVYQATEAVTLRFDQAIDRGAPVPTNAEGGANLSFYVGIEAEADTIADMNMALADEFADRDLFDLLQKVTYAFVPSEGMSRNVDKDVQCQ